MSTTETRDLTKVVTGKVRLSYFSGWEPTSVEEGGEKKYSTAVLIDKSDKTTLGKIEKIVEHLKAEAKKKWGKLPIKFKTPLRDGDAEKADDDNYAGKFFLNATSKTKPGIVDKACNEITDKEEVYSGAYARVSMNLYLFDKNGNRGIACGLNNIQKLADGEALAGRSKPEDDFVEEYEPEDDDV